MANTNQRGYPKGIREIRYPSEDIIQRFTSKDYTGEIRLNNETGEFLFNPPLNINSESEGTINMYDDLLEYESNNTFVYYQNEESPDSSFHVLGVYRCIENTVAGESPETNPEKWLYQGTNASNIQIESVQDLRTELNSRVRYSDLNNQFNIEPVTYNVGLNLKYITVNDYLPSEDIPPSENEVLINGITWQKNNLSWTDYGDGITVYNGNDPNTNPDYAFNLTNFGRLYSVSTDVIDRVLAANPGYRIPTQQDWIDTFSNELVVYTTSNSNIYYPGNMLDTSQELWNSTVTWDNSKELSLTAGGEANTSTQDVYSNIKNIGRYLVKNTDAYGEVYYSFITVFITIGEPRIRISLVRENRYSDATYSSIRLVKDI